jgi:ABC-type cobalamin/Fe3+-siderophores transport system ATPase subunit
MTNTLLSVENLQVTVEGKVVLDGLQFELAKSKVVALIGANGSGKSS